MSCTISNSELAHKTSSKKRNLLMKIFFVPTIGMYVNKLHYWWIIPVVIWTDCLALLSSSNNKLVKAFFLLRFAFCSNNFFFLVSVLRAIIQRKISIIIQLLTYRYWCSCYVIPPPLLNAFVVLPSFLFRFS